METLKDGNNLKVIREVEEILTKDMLIARIAGRNAEKQMLDDLNAKDELLLLECDKLGIKTEAEVLAELVEPLPE